MVIAGIDVGSLTTKAVILKDGKIAYEGIEVTAEDADTSTRKILESHLKEQGISIEDIDSIGCTGVGRRDLTFANVRKTIPLCLVKGIQGIFPSVRTIIDIGAETSHVVKINEKGQLEESIVQDKCGAGSGTFLEAITKVLQMPLEQMAELALQARHRAEIGNTCAIFIEQEVISHLHKDPPTPVSEVIAGVFGAMAVRSMGMITTVGSVPDVAVCGGVAKNPGMIKALEEELGVKVLVPDEPQLVAALGVAYIARERAEAN